MSLYPHHHLHFRDYPLYNSILLVFLLSRLLQQPQITTHHYDLSCTLSHPQTRQLKHGSLVDLHIFYEHVSCLLVFFLVGGNISHFPFSRFGISTNHLQ